MAQARVHVTAGRISAGSGSQIDAGASCDSEVASSVELVDIRRPSISVGDRFCTQKCQVQQFDNVVKLILWRKFFKNSVSNL